MIWTVVVVWLWANTMAAYNKRFRVFSRVSRGGVSFPSTMHHNQAARDTLPNSITQSRCRCISIWTHLQIDIVLQGGVRLRLSRTRFANSIPGDCDASNSLCILPMQSCPPQTKFQINLSLPQIPNRMLIVTVIEGGKGGICLQKSSLWN